MVEGVLGTPDGFADRSDEVLGLDQHVALRTTLLVEDDHIPTPDLVEADDLSERSVEPRLGLQPRYHDALAIEPGSLSSGS